MPEMPQHLQDLVISQMSNARRVARQVWVRAPQSLDLEELTSLASLGLVNAAQRWEDYCAQHDYDPLRIEYFVPYAQRRMKGAIFDSLRQSDHVKRSLRDRSKVLQEHGYGSGASDAELSERTGLTRGEVREAINAVEQRPVYLEPSMEYEMPTRDVESAFMESVIVRAQVQAISFLPPAHQAVLALRYYSGLELKQIAHMLGVNESRASHVHTEAVLAVHDAMRAAASSVC